jgi:hypothetical protein
MNDMTWSNNPEIPDSSIYAEKAGTFIIKPDYERTFFIGDFVKIIDNKEIAHINRLEETMGCFWGAKYRDANNELVVANTWCPGTPIYENTTIYANVILR